MKACTAQKMVLNIFSTATMIRMGMTYDNWTINVRMTNEKLRARGIRILEKILGVEQSRARGLVGQSGGELNVAVLMGRLGCRCEEAQQRLAANDVMEATWEALNTVSGALASHGTTSFLPTTVSASTEVLGESIRHLARLQEGNFVGANPIGIHLEGPFISPIRRGTHPGEHIRDADAVLLEKWIDMSDGAVRLLTIAPEVEGIDAAIKVAQARGVTVAMGHSDATM